MKLNLRILFWMMSRMPLGMVPSDVAAQHGVHILRRHYYSPIPDETEIDDEYWEQKSELVGIDMGEKRALALIGETFPPHLAEFRQLFPIALPAVPGGFHLINGTYMAVDAHVYWSLIRHLKPRRIIEIGAGKSTLVSARAMAENRECDGTQGSMTAIEPYHSDLLQSLKGSGVEVVAKKVQEVPLETFQSLGEGDILFIDSSHVLREGNDVLFEYTEVLPRLSPGVWVHVHDISLPKRYPRAYFGSNLFWNEQYLLQAYLAFNPRVEVMWPGNFMMLNHSAAMLETFPEIETMRKHYPMSEPTAFWFRTSGSSAST